MGASSSKQSNHYADFEAALPSLEGKTVAITGCTTGTGLVAAICAVHKGASTVLMLNRESERATAAEETVKKEIKEGQTVTVETISCDLQNLASVQKAADTIKAKYSKLDVLCNNAGVMALDDYATTDGYDVQMQTNHLSHFLLTKELISLLGKSDDARVVHHSSDGRHGEPLKPEYFGKNGGNLGGNGSSMIFNGAKWQRYHQTKLANSVMTAALAEKLKDNTQYPNIKAVCAAPGLAQTNLQTTTNATGGMSGSMWMMAFAQSGEDGAMGLLSACFSPETANGDFWEPKNGFTGVAVKVEMNAHSKDADQQKMLWEASEEAVGKFKL